jgi:hypothetical protein
MNIKIIILGAICMFFLSACKLGNFPPERKDNIPEESRWYGGSDGGVWILISSANFPNQYKVVVYFENGSIWSNGLYQVCKYCQTDSMNIEEIKNNIEAFDGEAIILRTIKQGKYCTLLPVACH